MLLSHFMIVALLRQGFGWAPFALSYFV